MSEVVTIDGISDLSASSEESEGCKRKRLRRDVATLQKNHEVGYQRDHLHDWCQLQRLDASEKPGLTQEELEDILVKCDFCGLLTIPEMFNTHKCEVEDSEAELAAGLTDVDDEV
jgi:hypothetical protein